MRIKSHCYCQMTLIIILKRLRIGKHKKRKRLSLERLKELFKNPKRMIQTCKWIMR
jgi:hypothetical protein